VLLRIGYWCSCSIASNKNSNNDSNNKITVKEKNLGIRKNVFGVLVLYVSNVDFNSAAGMSEVFGLILYKIYDIFSV
jgi:hypothetical protein